MMNGPIAGWHPVLQARAEMARAIKRFAHRSGCIVIERSIWKKIPAWQVLRTSGVASRFEAQHESKLTPLFGRDEEIELLLRRWRGVSQGEGRVVVLTGEPGIGKSHITLALQERLLAEPHIRLHYFCSAHHTNSALLPFVGQLERAAQA
jgi:ATP-dependent Clp protease ATP-binding subunit ClpA